MAKELLDYQPTTPGLEPECEVLIDGTWCEGFVRAWYRYADHWKASVQYSTQPGSNHLATFAESHIRQTKPSSGREGAGEATLSPALDTATSADGAPHNANGTRSGLRHDADANAVAGERTSRTCHGVPSPSESTTPPGSQIRSAWHRGTE
jgi:hypothetical protein